jgi:hypothetical protein
MDYRYAILMETNGGEYESWYNFIRYEGNEDALEHLEEQFKKVDFHVLDDLSTFDLELKRLVSETTAREMCKVDVNAYMFHRKFDGKLEKIDFKFSKRDDDDTKIEKVNERIGMGDIDQYITHEDACDTDFSLYSGNDSDHSESGSDSGHSSHSSNSSRSSHSGSRRKHNMSHKKDEEPHKKEEKKEDHKKDEEPRKKEEKKEDHKKDEEPRKKEEKKEDHKKDEEPRKKEEKKEDHKKDEKKDERKKDEKIDSKNDVKNERDKKREKK